MEIDGFTDQSVKFSQTSLAVFGCQNFDRITYLRFTNVLSMWSGPSEESVFSRLSYATNQLITMKTG